jgi:PKD domain-containing protein
MRVTNDGSRRLAARWKLRAAVAGVAAAGLVAGTVALTGSAAVAGAPRGAGIAVKTSHNTVSARPAVARLAPRHGRFLGIMPSGSARFQKVAGTANGTPPLVYHGGPVQHAETTYAIFWAPSGHYLPGSYRSTVGQYFGDVAHDSYKTSNVYAASTQFYDKTGPGGGKNWVSYNVNYAGSVLDTDAVPASGCANYTLGDFSTTFACLLDSQLQTEISHVVSAQHLPTGLGVQYFLFTPPGLGSCFDSNPSDGCYDPELTAGYCAYHSNIGGTTLYANMPWADISGCQYSTANNPYPNDDGADTVINVVSHEQNETMTDPLGNAWFDSSGFENGDECAWLSETTHFNGIGDYSQTINSDEYMMQFEWSNRKNNCVGTNTFVQPTGSFTAAAGTGTHAEKFTASASDTDDTAFTYGWNFGDGTSSLVGTASTTHTYAAAGTYTVTLVIFDAKGDQVRIVKSVVVS